MVGTLVEFLLSVLMMIYSCVDVLKDSYVALLLGFLNGVFNKLLIKYDGFCMMGLGGNINSTFPESV